MAFLGVDEYPQIAVKALWISLHPALLDKVFF